MGSRAVQSQAAARTDGDMTGEWLPQLCVAMQNKLNIAQGLNEAWLLLTPLHDFGYLGRQPEGDLLLSTLTSVLE